MGIQNKNDAYSSLLRRRGYHVDIVADMNRKAVANLAGSTAMTNGSVPLD